MSQVDRASADTPATSQPEQPDTSTPTQYLGFSTGDVDTNENMAGFTLSADQLPPLVQCVQSLDHLEESAAQLFGTSAESDPWLLRHCRYDKYGMCNLHRMSFRTVGGVPVERLVPVHFQVAEDSLFDHGKEETGVSSGESPEILRKKVDALVSPDDGRRLISLFIKFVFPLMPVISRSQLRLCQLDPSSKITPVHLLAAIYASAIPFRIHDPSLCVSGAYQTPPSDQLWRIVYEVILREIHTPKLAVLQSALLYLQRFPKDTRAAASDSPFVWSFFGAAANLAHSLGLQLECRRWGIPSWEKRLRRRLWWVVYVEDKWRSLLAGRPPMIRPEEWDVSVLERIDFEVDELPYNLTDEYSFQQVWDDGTLFRTLARLAPVAETLQSRFYSLQASQKLFEDFRASIDAARTIRLDLQAWYSSLPEPVRLRNFSDVNGAAVLHLSYLTLEVLLYRAILRPLGRASPPPPIAGDMEPSTTEFPWFFENLDVDHLTQLPALETVELDEAAETTINAAEKLTSSDFDSFWHSWTRTCFSLISNFIVLLLVQAPTASHAIRSKQLLDTWTHHLRCQLKNHEGVMTLAIVRLSSLQTGGLGRQFHLPSHVIEQLDVGIMPGQSLRCRE
ncbi:hypothetical protein FE257_008421 [Aspergillus nanangensis]|uniref:Xylanolytic transcriptional activator regulatory domain-containing protein n=1 Tax=Aspergillus nanangensis TaxID=2582783 RepID=A0AAD4CMV3_ASPNN|nr:hypothetical protein FE257_008421 [Aspergillus nanangensis]